MPCYICEKCGAIDNTAVGGYWRNILNKEIPKCSECNYGKWHGKFEKKHWFECGTVEELIEMEDRNDGSMLNATEYFKKIGEKYENN